MALSRLGMSYVLAIDQDGAVADSLKARDHAQQGRLARPGRPDKRDEFSFIHCEINVLNDTHGAKGFRNRMKLDRTHCPTP